MDEWVDGWLEGDGWVMDGRGWMDGWLEGDRWIHRLAVGWLVH